jgi:hypothetical protein
MRKKTSTAIGLAVATILTAYISALTLSNQAFAALARNVPPVVSAHVQQILAFLKDRGIDKPPRQTPAPEPLRP